MLFHFFLQTKTISWKYLSYTFNLFDRFLILKKVNFHHYMIIYMMVNVNQFFLFVFRTKRSRKPAIWNSLPVSGWCVSRYGHIPEQCQENPHMYVNYSNIELPTEEKMSLYFPQRENPMWIYSNKYTSSYNYFLWWFCVLKVAWSVRYFLPV